MFFEENQYLYSPALPRSARTKMSKLLNAFELERSSVVANSLMNRERRLTGGNSYTRDLCLNPVDFISGRLATQHQITWLDICCGTGRALIDAGRLLVADRSSEKIAITGIDLVSMFDNVPNDLGFLRLKETAVLDWVPSESFDLITCVHGLHYVGDKLRLIELACSWLKPDGLFITNLGLDNLKLENETKSRTVLRNSFRTAGLEYDSRKHLLWCRGQKQIRFEYEYLGADDDAGPNYTGQPAVDSHYRKRTNY